MANRRDYRDRTISNGTDDFLFIEGPQILQRSATTRHNQQIRPWHRAPCRHRIKTTNGTRHLRRSIRALHQRAPKQNMHPEPVGQAVQDIANHRPCRAGYNTDDRRHARQWLFPRRIKQPFSGQPPAAFLKLFQHGAFAGDLHLLHNNLVFRPAAIDCQLAGDNDLKSFLGLHGKLAGNHFPADSIKRAAIILEGEIDMPGGRTGRARDFGPYTHEIKGILDRGLQPTSQFADGQKRCV